MTYQLCEPIVDNNRGLRNTNFFNGRLLAAEDLRAQQVAERQHHGQLGQAVGSGVVHGLDVQPAAGDPYRLTIAAGLAINGNGQTLELPVPVDLAVAVASAVATDPGQFVDCTTFRPLLATGMGAYALLMAPASGFLQNAPKSGVGANGAITGCGARYQVEGVTFRMVRFDPAGLPGLPPTSLTAIDDLMSRTNLANLAAAPPTDQADLSLLRNRLAHACLGTDQLAGLPMDPLRGSDRSSDVSYGGLDALRASGDLTADDVPLALVYWTLIGIRFVDMWAVRRRPIRPAPSTLWPEVVADRRLAEGEARLQQFQDQMNVLLSLNLGPTAFAALRVTDTLRYLPPAGVLPLGTPGTPGLLPAIYFGQLPHRDPEFVDERLVPSLLEESLEHDPIDIASGELVWLYRTWQNGLSVDRGTGARPYVIFTTGQMHYRATARFDLARWDYSNFVEAD